MKLGILLGYSGGKMDVGLETVKLAESLGFDSAWTAEAYGSDAVSPAAWILAQTSKIKVGTSIMQIPARTPACTTMTAMTLQDLSGGRFILGLGPSGPQVAEGWHGVPYGKPMVRVKEYVEIVRTILKREDRLEFHGEEYDIPYTGPRATGLGKPLKSILHGDPTMPIYTAAITPAGIRTSAEVADGFFPIWMNPSRFDIFQEDIDKGLSKAGGGKSLSDFDVAPFVQVALGDDVNACRNKIRPGMALYIGGMGARSKNFYNDYAKRLGFEDAAVKIQDLFLSGKKEEAAAAIPDELVDAVALCGPKERIRERLQPWKEAAGKHHVGSMLIGRTSPEALKVVAEEML
jgi:F420-dependent oxidoreductase-like protein